jgi:Protein of unknown function/AsmA-like C-terminal region
LRRCLWGLSMFTLLIVAGLVALAFPPGGREITLPDWARARLEARIDGAMPGGDVTLGSVGMRLSRERMLPQILFSDVTMSVDGQPRMVFPQLSVSIDPGSALTGTIRPRRVQLAGAGLRLVRAEDGSLDLAFAGGATDQTRDLAQTLTGIDRMFAQPGFDYLESVTAQGVDLVIENAGTDDRLEIADATLSLVPVDGALTLAVGGDITGVEAGRLDLNFTRWAARAETEITAGFDNLRARDVAGVSDALTWLSLIEAPMSGQMMTVIRDDASLGHLTGELRVAAGQVHPGAGVDPIALDGLELNFDYDAATRRLQVQDLTIQAPNLTTTISGYADLLEGPVYVAQFQMDQITADMPGILENPVQFQGGALDMRLQLFPALRVDLGQLVLYDEGLHLRARGRAAVEEGGLTLSIDATSAEIDAGRVLPLWPLASITNTRNWLAANLLGGTIRNLNAGLRLRPGSEPQFGLTFDFEDAQVRALQRMAPVEDGRGYLTIADNILTLALDGGQVTAPNGGRLQLAGSTMRISDIRVRRPETRFDLQVSGEVPAALTLIASEPLHLLDQFPFDPATVATGTVDLDVQLDLILRRGLTPRDVDFRIGGTLAQIRSDTLVQGRALRADALAIDADNTRLEIGGAARLDTLSANASWSRAIGPDAPADSQIAGTATLTPEALADFGVVLPDGMLQGQGYGDFTLDLAPGRAAELTLRSDLAGIALAIPALDWRLPGPQTGALLAEVTLGETPSVPRLEISGALLDMSGSVALDGTSFSQLAIDHFSIGDWIDITGGLIDQGDGQLLVRITGGNVDLRGLPQSSDTGAGASSSLPMQIMLDHLTVTDSIYLTNLSAQIGGSPISGDFRGLVGGRTSVSGSILGEADGMSLRMRAEDGGAVLRASGIYDNAYGGAFDLILRPHPGQGNYAGLLTIDNPRLRDAPAFAELLSLVSVVGLIEQMATGEGVALGAVRADFRINPRAITIVEGTALGPAMGLSLDGVYNTQAETVDFQGVVSPFYLVNGLMGALFSPRREGLFGFTYRMRGPPDNSTVTVNPLSVLTPGIFREIFRSPPPEIQ